MRVTHLELRDVRNHGHTKVDFAPGVTVVHGPNGSGKTSMLEAIALVATNRSFRSSDDKVLVREGADLAVIVCGFERGGREIEIRVGLGAVPHRFVLNGGVRRKASDVVGLLRTIVFAPDDLELVKAGPSVRRSFLDAAMVEVTPRLERTVGDWERVLRQRNQLLRSLPARSTAPPTLDTWSELAAAAGAALTAERVAFVTALRPAFVEAAADFGIDTAGLSYRCDWSPRVAESAWGFGGRAGPAPHEPHSAKPADPRVHEGSGDSLPGADDLEADLASSLEEDLAAALAEVVDKEIERGLTLRGPHHDDLVVTLDGRDARTRASQGEQRTLALCLRLAHLDRMEAVLDEAPVLLLDDVLSELDPARRAVLLGRLPAAQVILTATSDGTRIPDDVLGAFATAGAESELSYVVLGEGAPS